MQLEWFEERDELVGGRSLRRRDASGELVEGVERG